MASVSARVGYHEVDRVEKSEFPSERDSASVAASPSLKISLHSLWVWSSNNRGAMLESLPLVPLVADHSRWLIVCYFRTRRCGD
jgi:hypothetical protein